MGARGQILDNTNTLRMVFIIRSFQIIESFTNNNIKDSKKNFINQCSWIHLNKIIRITWIKLADTAKIMYHIAGFRGQKCRHVKSDNASYWTLSCKNSFKGPVNESIAVFERVSAVRHWISKENLFMVKLLFYKLKGELVSTKWGYYTFWRHALHS